jgi:hypothetical protein
MHDSLSHGLRKPIEHLDQPFATTTESGCRKPLATRRDRSDGVVKAS